MKPLQAIGTGSPCALGYPGLSDKSRRLSADLTPALTHLEYLPRAGIDIHWSRFREPRLDQCPVCVRVPFSTRTTLGSREGRGGADCDTPRV